jgi:hypothetical protein
MEMVLTDIDYHGIDRRLPRSLSWRSKKTDPDNNGEIEMGSSGYL